MLHCQRVDSVSKQSIRNRYALGLCFVQHGALSILGITTADSQVGLDDGKEINTCIATAERRVRAVRGAQNEHGTSSAPLAGVRGPLGKISP